MYIKPLKIGNVELENNILLAPMAGVTDLPFRIICKKYGTPGLVYTEMASSKAIYHDDIKTKELLKTENEKRPVAVQIFGSDPEIMGYATRQVEQYGDIIDINMGCPAPKIVKNGDGSRLLQDIELIGKIVEKCVKSTKKPVTVKIRIGWSNENIVAVEAAKVIEMAGAKAITVHGRTREQYYSGDVNLNIIKQVKENVKIPVIGNGDINDYEDAINMFKKTNVDGIMIGRASMGNPWIIREILENTKLKIGLNQRLDVIEEHLNLAISEKGEYIAIREMRKHICWYIKNLKDSSKLRNEINKIEQKDKLVQTLEEYFNTLKIE